ncbi:MAG: hypothetical protein WDN30_09865 [Pararobbsia sp.]
MNQQQQGPTGFFKSIATFADVLALAIALLMTPRAFDLTKRPLFHYFMKTWGRDFAELFVWVMGAIEAYLIFMATSFVLTGALVWLVTTLVMRRFKE